jgi:hypothetical protein
MLAGVFCVLLGEAIRAASLPLLGWFAAFVVVNVLYIPLSKEPGPVHRFGEDYRTYKANVPRWLPRIRAWEATRRREPEHAETANEGHGAETPLDLPSVPSSIQEPQPGPFLRPVHHRRTARWQAAGGGRVVRAAGRSGPALRRGRGAKPRVLFKVRTAFATVAVGKNRLAVVFVLGRRLKDRRIENAQEEYPGIVHFLRIEKPEDLDAALAGWLQEAYDRRQRKDQGGSEE